MKTSLRIANICFETEGFSDAYLGAELSNFIVSDSQNMFNVEFVNQPLTIIEPNNKCRFTPVGSSESELIYDEYGNCFFKTSFDGKESLQFLISYAKLKGKVFVANNDISTSIALKGIESVFSMLAPKFNAVHIHASCVVYNKKGYLFLGKSGTGKSTHAMLWEIANQGTWLLNDDGPMIRISDGKPWVFGSPWSGKTPCYKNQGAPIGGIVQIHQSTHNNIKQSNPLRAMSIIAPCIINDMKWDKNQHSQIVNILKQVVESVPVYDLWCNATLEAAILCKQVVADGRIDLCSE